MHWPILGFYNNWKTIHCIESRKQHESTDTEINIYINVHMKQNTTSNIALNIGRGISDKGYESILKTEKCRKLILSC